MIGARHDPLDPTERSTRVPSFSNTLEQAIHTALANANARRHELATLEHLLLALTEDPTGAIETNDDV